MPPVQPVPRVQPVRPRLWTKPATEAAKDVRRDRLRILQAKETEAKLFAAYVKAQGRGDAGRTEEAKARWRAALEEVRRVLPDAT